MNAKQLRRVGVIVSTGLLVLCIPSMAAAEEVADDPGKIAAETQPYVSEPGHVVNLTVAKGKNGAITPNVTGSGGRINGYTARTITPPGGRAGTYNLGFNSYYSSGCGFTTCTINVSSGTSYTRWLGSSPYNASSMSLSDRIWVGGTNISVSVGVPPSAGISISTSDNGVTMSNKVSNTWRNEHNFANIKFSTHIAMWGPYESASSAATFSWQTFYNNIG